MGATMTVCRCAFISFGDTTTQGRVVLTSLSIASDTLHMSPADSFGASVVNGVTGLVFALLGGALSTGSAANPC